MRVYSLIFRCPVLVCVCACVRACVFVCVLVGCYFSFLLFLLFGCLLGGILFVCVCVVGRKQMKSLTFQ